MSGIWSWSGVAWTTDEHSFASQWDHTNDYYLPLDQNLQRVIVRDGLTIYTAQDQVPTFFSVCMGFMTYVVLVGTDELGLRPVETHHLPLVWSAVWVNDKDQDRHGEAHGYVPELNVDLAVKRTNGVDRNGQTHVQVRRSFISGAFGPNGSFPVFWGSGELNVLGHAP